MSKRFIFIEIEGVDGSGKSSVVNELGVMLRTVIHDRKIIFTRDPLMSDYNRRVMKPFEDGMKVTPMQEVEMFAKCRQSLVEHIIRPNLARGHIVISDRYLDSSLAYQGYGLGVNLDLIKRANPHGMVTQPSLKVLLRVDVSTAMARMSQTSRIEWRGEAFMQQVINGYDELSKRQPTVWRVVDATKPLDEVVGNVFEIVVEHIKGCDNE